MDGPLRRKIVLVPEGRTQQVLARAWNIAAVSRMLVKKKKKSISRLPDRRERQ